MQKAAKAAFLQWISTMWLVVVVSPVPIFFLTFRGLYSEFNVIVVALPDPGPVVGVFACVPVVVIAVIGIVDPIMMFRAAGGCNGPNRSKSQGQSQKC